MKHQKKDTTDAKVHFDDKNGKIEIEATISRDRLEKRLAAKNGKPFKGFVIKLKISN
jgi:hypothetical protein